MTKLELYRRVSRIRKELDITESSYPLDTIQIIKGGFPNIRFHRRVFDTYGVHGMVILDRAFDGIDVLTIDKNRDSTESNFDCTHEFMHTQLHRSNDVQTFVCHDVTRTGIDLYKEWEANEGASEFLVPAKLFIPEAVKHTRGNISPDHFFEVRYFLAGTFNVSEGVIATRLDSLMYEIDQYINGVPIDNIKVLSRTEQSRRNIHIESLNRLATPQIKVFSMATAENKRRGSYEDERYWRRLWGP